MAIATGKRPRATLVKQEAVNQVSTFLTELPEKTKEDLSLKEAVEQMQDSIKAVLAKGYNYAEVAKMLSEKGIKISALTLKNYVPSGRRQAAKGKVARPRKATAASSEAVSEAPEAAPETPAKSTRARKPAAKTAASATTKRKTSRSAK